jgi:hypothetical protein
MGHRLVTLGLEVVTAFFAVSLETGILVPSKVMWSKNYPPGCCYHLSLLCSHHFSKKEPIRYGFNSTRYLKGEDAAITLGNCFCSPLHFFHLKNGANHFHLHHLNRIK